MQQLGLEPRGKTIDIIAEIVRVISIPIFKSAPAGGTDIPTRLALLVTMSTLCGSAHAAPLGEAPIEYEEFTPGMIAELRAYADDYWAHVDDPQNAPPPAAVFSFPTEPNFDPFYITNALFSQIYREQLTLTPDEGTPYYIEDLARDDPQILSAYRHHSITGELLTRVTSTQASQNHLELALEGTISRNIQDVCDPVYVVDRQTPVLDGPFIVNTFDEAFTQTASKKKPAPCNPSGPPPQIPVPLRDAVDDAHLDQEECWLQDGGWWHSDPGFDCDDFADAMAEWLKRRFPDAEIWNLMFSYAGGGHAMTVIRIDGYFYLIDAQGAEIRGPFLTAAEVHEAAKQLMRDSYGMEFWWIDPYRRFRWAEPGWRPALREPVRWWESQDMLEHFCDCFGEDPNDYMPADQPDYQCP